MDVRERASEDLAREVLGVRRFADAIQQIAVNGVHVTVVKLGECAAIARARARDDVRDRPDDFKR